MHLKFRRGSALLYRSVWVPKGADANTHGFSRQTYVGSLPVTTEAIPEALRGRLSDDECAFVDARICAPAKAAAERQRREAERRERDPGWRLEEAQRLANEAVERSAGMPVSAASLGALQEALARLKTDGSAPHAATAMSQVTDDPLQSALAAVQGAARAVAAGRYGKAPAEQVRSTRTYRLWADLWEATQGEGDASLLRALQARGFVKRRGC